MLGGKKRRLKESSRNVYGGVAGEIGMNHPLGRGELGQVGSRGGTIDCFGR
jgi:hypothetical protein